MNVTLNNPMDKANMVGLLWVACATFMAFYGPQPLFPAIQETFSTSSQEVSLLMTLTIAPLGFAPLVYSKIFSALSSKTLLVASLILCAFSLAVPAFATNFNLILVARGVQGITIPAIALILMTNISCSVSSHHLQRAMTLYATATMIGAYGGRVISGFMGSVYSWRLAFIILSIFVLSSAIYVAIAKNTHTVRFEKLSLKDFKTILSQENFIPILLIGPLCIFSYASVLNFIPFRMKELNPLATEAQIGIMYISALLCASLGIFSKKILQILGGELRTIRVGLFFFIIGSPLLIFDSIIFFVLSTFLFGIGFSLIYTNMPGIVNQISKSEKSLTNAVYLCFYYTSSALGTWLLIFAYSILGLHSYVGFLLFTFFLAGFLTKYIKTGILE